MAVGLPIRRPRCSGFTRLMGLGVLWLWQSTVTLVEGSVALPSTGVSTRVTDADRVADPRLDFAAYELPSREATPEPLEEDIKDEEAEKAEADKALLKEQLELAELVGDYALDERARLVSEMDRSSRKAAMGVFWALVFVGLFELMYQVYLKPAAPEMQRAYRSLHPGREPRNLSMSDIIMASPLASAIAAAIFMGLTISVVNMTRHFYIAEAKSMDLATFTEEQKLKEQEKAAQKKSAEGDVAASPAVASGGVRSP